MKRFVKMTGYISDPLYALHLTGTGHPECPARIEVVAAALQELPLKSIPARDANEEEILRCHTQEYVHVVQRDVALCQHSGKISLLSTGDAVISAESWRAALRAAGGVLSAVEAVMQKKVKNAFCLVRPPGHHAESHTGMGFCLLNNVAIGARYAQQFTGIERIAIVDWDVHHGNGTQEIFDQDPSVFYFSTHQHPLYPGTGMANEIGTGAGKGTTLNCPIPPGESARKNVIEAFQNQWVPAMEAFHPNFIFISAGFDGHQNDTLGNFNLKEEDFALLTHIVSEIAEKYAEKRIVSVLEGGYFLPALATSVKAHVSALLK